MSDDEARGRAGRSQNPVESWPVWFNRFSEAAERRGWSKERRLDEF